MVGEGGGGVTKLMCNFMYELSGNLQFNYILLIYYDNTSYANDTTLIRLLLSH